MATNTVYIRLQPQGFLQTVAQANQVTSSLRQMAGAFTSVYVGKQILAAFKGVLDPAIEYQHALRRTDLASRAMGQGMGDLDRKIKTVSASMGFNAVEGAKAAESLLLATGNIGKAVAGVKKAMLVSQAMGGEISPERVASEMLAPLTKMLGGNIDAAYVKLDQLAGMAEKAGVKLEVFGKSTLTELSLASYRTDQSFTDLAAAFLLSERAGLKTLQNLSNIKLLGTQLSKLGGKQANPLEAWGIVPRDPVTGKVVPLPVLINKYLAAEKIDKYAFSKTFGKGAGVGLFGIAQAAKQEMARLKLTSAESLWAHYTTGGDKGGTIARRAKEWEAGPEAAMRRFHAALNQAAVALGTTLLPLFSQLSTYAIAFGDAVGKFSNSVVGGFVTKLASNFMLLGIALFGVKAILWGVARMLAVTQANVNGLTVGLRTAGGAAVGVWAHMRRAYTGFGLDLTRSHGPVQPGVSRGVVGGPRGIMAAAGVGLRAVGSGLMGLLGGVPGILLTILALLPQIADWTRRIVNATTDWLMGTGAERDRLTKLFGEDKAWLILLLQHNPFSADARKAGVQMEKDLLAKQTQSVSEKWRAERDAADYLIKASQVSAGYMQQGSKQWNDVIDRVRGLSEYDTARVDATQVGRARRAFRSMEKGGMYEGTAGINAMARAEDLLKQHDLSPNQQKELLFMAVSGARFLSRGVARGVIGQDVLRSYREKFSRQLLGAAGEQGVQAETGTDIAAGLLAPGSRAPSAPPGREWASNVMTDLWAGTTKHSYDDIAKLRDEAPKLIAVLGENHEMSRQLKQAMEALDRTVREAQQKGSH